MKSNLTRFIGLQRHFLNERVRRILSGPSASVFRKVPRYGQNFDAFKFFRIVVCGNQGWLIQYLFLISRKHRDLKEHLGLSKPEVETTKHLASDLTKYSREEFFSAAGKNFDYLRSYFMATRGAAPRLCIKGSFLENGQSQVITIFRDSQVRYDGSYDIGSNSGFLHCVTTGQYFLDNDLPDSTLKGRYKNPRLSQEKVIEIASSVLMSKHKTVSSNWELAWNVGEGSNDSAYKSTLIVPMTLWNNDLSPEFLEKYNAEKADRLIFGFLCFDSDELNFFSKSDVDVGYVVADFLSLFAYAMFNYTDYSKTYLKASSIAETTENFMGFSKFLERNQAEAGHKFHLDPMEDLTRTQKTDNNAIIHFVTQDISES